MLTARQFMKVGMMSMTTNRYWLRYPFRALLALRLLREG
jgi:hypothetical protein